jgi:hypothetical protein
MRLVAAITDPSVAQRILECLALPPRAPPLAPANKADLELVTGRSPFEPTLTETQSDSSFDFDPSPDEESPPNGSRTAKAHDRL